MKLNYCKSALFALLAAFAVILAGCPDEPPPETPYLVSLTVSAPPTKTVYALGEALDLTGLVVTGTYSGGFTKTEAVSPANVSGYDSSVAGEKTLTVTINGKTTTFTVTVALAALQSIAVSSPPTKTVYALEEALDLTGLVVTGTYSDNSTQTQTVSLSNISGYDSSVAGEKTLTVTINGKTTTFAVTVKPPRPDNMIESISELASYLSNASGGSAAADPVSVALAVNLGDGGWASVLSAINSAGKFVDLDLSWSTMSGTEFNPGTGAGADKVASLALPYGAQSIKAGTYSDSAFKAFTNLKTIIGTGITAIDAYSYVFRNNTVITSVSLLAATSIGGSAFYGCASLASISLSASLTTISGSALSGCPALTNITVDEGNTTFSASGGMLLDKAGTTLIAYPSASGAITLSVAAIGSDAFYNTKITSITASSVASIGSDAFYNCDNLVSVSLPAVVSIGSAAFSYCRNLVSISLPASLTTIEPRVFSGCTALTNITVDEGNTTFSASGGMLLDKAGTTLIAYPSASGAITLSVAAIGSDAFYSCDSLTSVSLPAAVSIGSDVFIYCRNLVSVSLPVAVSIGSDAFYFCTSLTSVSLPATPPSLGSDVFAHTQSSYGSSAITITVPSGSSSEYTSAWGVPAATAAEGNTSKYGSSHNAISIVES